MKNVTIYSTATCPYCKREKQYLAEKSIEFTNYDIGEDQAKADEMIQKTGQMGVPVTVISNGDEQVIVGFDRNALDKALRKEI